LNDGYARAPITNHFSASHLSPITSHFSQPRKQPSGVHLRLFTVTAAFGAARNLQKILGSGFEIVGIRVSQCEIRVFFGL
jgi:hypothetical protein